VEGNKIEEDTIQFKHRSITIQKLNQVYLFRKSKSRDPTGSGGWFGEVSVKIVIVLSVEAPKIKMSTI
jgi:hypothetical protein